MSILKLDDTRRFSFEVLPPLKGTGTEKLFADIDKLKEYNPAYINITTHHSEFVYRELPNGQYERQRIRRRPGTVAIAAAIQQKYGIPVQPHVICSGATIEDIEYDLLDLQFLGISDLLLLRGDKAKEDSRFVPTPGGHAHTTELMQQVKRFNEGFFADGTPIKNPGHAFDYGVPQFGARHGIPEAEAGTGSTICCDTTVLRQPKVFRVCGQGSCNGHYHPHHTRN